MPYLLPGSLDALLRELAAGQPVLVLLNPGFFLVLRWHYALAIGYDAVNEEMILHSGRERASHMQLTPFLNGWARWQLGNAGVAGAAFTGVCQCGSNAQRGIALEQAGGINWLLRCTRPQWRAGRRRMSCGFGLSNVRYRLTQPAAARSGVAFTLQLKPAAAPARLNLVELLLEQRRKPEALVLLDGGRRAGARADRISGRCAGAWRSPTEQLRSLSGAALRAASAASVSASACLSGIPCRIASNISRSSSMVYLLRICVCSSTHSPRVIQPALVGYQRGRRSTASHMLQPLGHPVVELEGDDRLVGCCAPLPSVADNFLYRRRCQYFR